MIMYDVLTQIRAKLIVDATLVGLVPAASIQVANQKLKSSYPHIALGVSGGSGMESADAFEGEVTFTIYTKNDQPYGNLSAIYDRIKELCHRKNLSGTTIKIGALFEQFVSNMMADPEVPDVYFMAARYSCLAFE